MKSSDFAVEMLEAIEALIGPKITPKMRLGRNAEKINNEFARRCACGELAITANTTVEEAVFMATVVDLDDRRSA